MSLHILCAAIKNAPPPHEKSAMLIMLGLDTQLAKYSSIAFFVIS